MSGANISTQTTTDNANICNMQKDLYYKKLNSSKDIINTSVTDVFRCADQYRYVPFMLLDVTELISNLKREKSAGNDHVDSEHVMYAFDKIYVFSVFYSMP